MNINWLGVVLATFSAFASGAIWFGPKTFFPIWWRAMGRDETTEVPGSGNMGVIFGSTFAGQFVQALGATLGYDVTGMAELDRLAAQLQHIGPARHRFDEGVLAEGSELQGEGLERVEALAARVQRARRSRSRGRRRRHPRGDPPHRAWLRRSQKTLPARMTVPRNST